MQPGTERVARIMAATAAVLAGVVTGKEPQACERLAAGAQYFVFVLLQFRCDVALGVLQCLPPHIVGRHGLRLHAAEFNEIAMYTVKADFERGESGTGALLLFQSQQEIAGVAAELAQFVEFGIVAVGDHTAFPDYYRRVFVDGELQQLRQCRVLGDALRKLGQMRIAQILQFGLHCRQTLQRFPQFGEIARTRRPQRHAGKDALNVADLFQQWLQRFETVVVNQALHRLLTRADFCM